MNKIVCYVCGTSYPENAEQCPICGYAQSAENSEATDTTESTYTYVKGGRFSKANVKKRNQASQKPTEVPVKATKTGKDKQKSDVSTIILIVVLLLAIIAVIGYIALRFFLPNDFIFEGMDNLKLPDNAQSIVETEPITTQVPPDPTEVTEADTVSLACTAVHMDTTEVLLEGIDSTFKLAVTLEPANTPDSVSYTSNDETVAKISDDGTITAVGEGTAVITVTCGSTSASATVICTVPEDETLAEEFTLNRKEITFNAEGQNWLLYDGVLPLEEIVWSSDDNSVATIENGKVVAVAEGDTIVYGTHAEQTAACVIHCKFEDTEQSGGITVADGTSGKTYALYNPYGNANDVTINIDETFTLKLVDEKLNDASGVEWRVENENVCSVKDGTVKGISSGMTEILATCEGKTYTCIVRVN